MSATVVKVLLSRLDVIVKDGRLGLVFASDKAKVETQNIMETTKKWKPELTAENCFML